MTSLKHKLFVALGMFAVIFGGFALWAWHGNPSDHPIAETTGLDPVLADPAIEHIPSVALAKPVGWAANEAPQAVKGLAVSRFAEGLDHPRTMLTLPNGDVIVAETAAPPSSNPGGLTGFFQSLLMRAAGAEEKSPDRLILLRDGDGDGRAEQRFTLRAKGLESPSGLAWGKDRLYVANHNAVLSFAFRPGETVLTGDGEKLMDLPGGGNHWMRNLLISADGARLYVAVGSASNIGERGMALETGRAGIWEIDLAKPGRRQYAAGMRNPNGMAWNPSTGELWTVVNERDMLGPDLVPDYLTNVPVGAQYGWPWFYWKDRMDWRVTDPVPEYMVDYTRKPEYALGAHVAALGLVFETGGHRMGSGFGNGAFIARHGSWNRKPLSGYDVVFVKFDDHGNPLGLPVPVLGGFLTGKGSTHGRPTWLAWDKAGALLVSDDTAGIIWRVIAPGSAPSPAPKPVVADHMPASKELGGEQIGSFKPGDGAGP